MDDVIEELNTILRRAHTRNKLKEHMVKILEKYDIIKSKKAVKAGLEHKNTPNCFFGLKVNKEDNIYNQDLMIMIKPDHSKNHRILSVYIQLDGKIMDKTEDEDQKHPDWTDKRIFFKELKDVEKDIKTFFKKTK